MRDLRHSVDAIAGDSRGDAARSQFAADVQYYLTLNPRQLPSRYLYDDLGSALFEAICRLPWYRITRAEGRLLARHRDELFRHLGPIATVVELGSGSGEKLKTLLDTPALEAREIAIHLVDLSPSALESSDRMLAPLPHLRVTRHKAAYETGLADAARRFEGAGRVLVLVLGSNIGNFDAPASHAFLGAVRRELRPGDALLLGADLIKPEGELLRAYDDPLGVTAAFNRNLLVRVNRELAGDFVVEQYAHQAVWNADASRVEMHLVAQTAQRVRVGAAQIEFDMQAGEIIWTESSYKYQPGDISRLLAAGGFRVTAQWLDRADGFALTLAEAV